MNCQFCGKESGNVKMHERFCKSKPLLIPHQEKIKKIQSYVQDISTTQANQITSGDFKKESFLNYYYMHSVFTWPLRKIFSRNKDKMPTKILSTQQIRDIKAETPKMTDEQKYFRFFGNLPKWTAKKPGWFTVWKLKRNNPDVIINHCVIMEESGDNKQCYIPYNKELGMLQTDTGFYDMPIRSDGTIWLDGNKFAPLVNRKNYKDEFDVPEDFASSLINTGIGYGQLKGFKDLVSEIKTTKTVMWGCIAAVVLLGIFVFLIVYSDNKAIHDMADQVGNLTAAVRRQ